MGTQRLARAQIQNSTRPIGPQGATPPLPGVERTIWARGHAPAAGEGQQLDCAVKLSVQTGRQTLAYGNPAPDCITHYCRPLWSEEWAWVGSRTRLLADAGPDGGERSLVRPRVHHSRAAPATAQSTRHVAGTTTRDRRAAGLSADVPGITTRNERAGSGRVGPGPDRNAGQPRVVSRSHNPRRSQSC